MRPHVTRRQPMTVPQFRQRKGSGEPIVMLTAYDRPTTLMAEAGGAEVLLVGDSLGMVLLGYDSTLKVTMDEMLHHARAVGRARRSAMLVVDMPWLSYHLSPDEAVRNAARFVREAGADAVKLEGGLKRLPAIEALVSAQIPVMGHLGLTPQSVLKMGGFKVQGRDAEAAETLRSDARHLEAAGCFGIVLEGIPARLAAHVTREVSVPTIGIGAGADCDGQVLVIHDLLGLAPGRVPKFVRRYGSLHDEGARAIERWVSDIRRRDFPAEDETYE